MLHVVEGEDLWHPVLWSGENSFGESPWDFDSLGVYYAEHGQYWRILPQKMSLLWKYRDSVEVVCLGNSRMLHAAIADELSAFALNMATIPCDLHCIEFLYETYISLHLKNLKYLVIGLDFDLWNEYEPMGAINVNRGDALGFQYDANHDYWPDGVDSLFVNRVEEIENTEKLVANTTLIDDAAVNTAKHYGIW